MNPRSSPGRDDLLIKDALRWSKPTTDLLLWAPEILATLGLALIWWTFAPTILRAPPDDLLGKEYARAATLALGPALLVAAFLRWDLTTKNSGFAYFLPRRVPLSHQLPASDLLWVPAPFALAGSLVLVAFVVALGWRTRTRAA